MNTSCPNLLRMANANLDSNTTATVVVENTSLLNSNIYKLRYNVGWTLATGAERLLIQVGPTGQTPVPQTYQVFDKDANPVQIGCLRRRRELLCFKFVNPPVATSTIQPHFVLLNPLCPLIIITPPASIVIDQGSSTGPTGPTGPSGSTGGTGATAPTGGR